VGVEHYLANLEVIDDDLATQVLLCIKCCFASNEALFKHSLSIELQRTHIALAHTRHVIRPVFLLTEPSTKRNLDTSHRKAEQVRLCHIDRFLEDMMILKRMTRARSSNAV
jgi:hypothetical protein